ncbi:DinB superfamily protein [Gillisia sp. Hel1_33_143]|uniref:DinB family protein n=1 Tax=Gillisia sp. Hel1_33_143 TaxID=1336796 RepID=UPI00087D475B|nr:DinB family protein [Gillisia sp. Hel1_33_143]SDS51811.1 DinB superfamily protein [Gillisia sp. Hel1_33_143]
MKLSSLRPGDHSPFYQTYLDYLPNEDVIDLLKQTRDEFLYFLDHLSEKDLKHSYAEGKWTVAQVLQHLLDTERIFQYRALTVSRNDKTSIPGYDHDSYVPASRADGRSLVSFKVEFELIRNSGIALFESFDTEMLTIQGNVNDSNFIPLAAGFIISGHQKHHLHIFKERYGL